MNRADDDSFTHLIEPSVTEGGAIPRKDEDPGLPDSLRWALAAFAALSVLAMLCIVVDLCG